MFHCSWNVAALGFPVVRNMATDTDVGCVTSHNPLMMTRSSAARRTISRLTVLLLVDESSLEAGTTTLSRDTSDHHVLESMERLVRRPLVAPFTTARALMDTLAQTTPDIVFNLTQHALDDRTMDSHVCAMLELEGIPYTGTGPRGLILARDKAFSKSLAAQAGFGIPSYFVVSSDPVVVPAGFPFPAVVKPRFGDASEGLSQRAVVGAPDALVARVHKLRESGCRDVICEEFIDGRELAVPMIGDRVVRPREVLFGRAGRGAPRIACSSIKHDPSYRRRWQVTSEFARITPVQEGALRTICTRAAALLEMRDYGHFDVKLTADGTWVFLEANPNPGLAKPGSSWSGHWDAVDYDEMMAEVVHRAWQRRR